MIRIARLTVLAVAVTLGVAGPAPAQIGHRVENLVVAGSAQNEGRKVKVHLWYPAEPSAYAAAPRTAYTSALYGKPLPSPWAPLAWKVDAQIARETSVLPAAGERLSVIVFSHGSVNDPIDYAWTLELIARAGFIVAAPYHVNNSQDDVRIDFINTRAGATVFPCEDGRPSPCSRTDNARGIQDRVRDISAVLDALPGWLGSRADVARAGVMGHSRGTVTALAAAGGNVRGEFGPERRVQAIMGMAIGARALVNEVDLAKVTVPTLLVAGGKDRNTPQAISEETILRLGAADKRLVAIPAATHRSFDSTYCAQLQSAGAIAQADPQRAILDQYSVPLIAASGPGGISGKAVHYCPQSFLTTPVDIRPVIAGTPDTEFPPALNDVCSVVTIPCTGLDSEAVKEQIVALAVDFFTAKLARAAGGVVSGTVPATLSLTLGAPASFGAFTPGVAKDYLASMQARVTSTAGDATLTASDPSTTAPGRLVNGSFALTSPLQVAGSPLPSTVKTYAAPVTNDNVTIDLEQPIAADEPLRTGTYAKTLTFTLSTSNP